MFTTVTKRLTFLQRNSWERQEPKGIQEVRAFVVYSYALVKEGGPDTTNIFQKYSEEEIENFKCIFEMFDKEKTGFIDVADLQTIMRSLGRDPTEAIDLIQSLELQTSPDENNG